MSAKASYRRATATDIATTIAVWLKEAEYAFVT